MTRLQEMVRAELSAIADGARPPTGLADTAIAVGARRRRLRALAAGGAVLAVTLAVGIQFAHDRRASKNVFDDGPGVDGSNVVYASTTNWLRGPWSILDTTNGGYRDVNVVSVSPPTTDLRYAVVLDAKQDRFGRYESSTGQITWFPAPFMLKLALISPDGRYLLGASYDPDDMARQGIAIHEYLGGQHTFVVLDTRTGSTTTFEANQRDFLPASQAANWAVTWLADSQHFAWGNVIFDLEGTVTKQLPIPEESKQVAVRPNGDGLFVITYESHDTNPLSSADPLQTTGLAVLVDSTGRVTHRTNLACNVPVPIQSPPAETESPNDDPSAPPAGSESPDGASAAPGGTDPPNDASSPPTPSGDDTLVPGVFGGPSALADSPGPPNPSPATNCADNAGYSIMLGWRSPDVVLVQTFDDQWYSSGPLRIDTINVRTGVEKAVFLMHTFSLRGDRVVVAPAGALPEGVSAIRF